MTSYFYAKDVCFATPKYQNMGYKMYLSVKEIKDYKTGRGYHFYAVCCIVKSKETRIYKGAFAHVATVNAQSCRL